MPLTKIQGSIAQAREAAEKLTPSDVDHALEAAMRREPEMGAGRWSARAIQEHATTVGLGLRVLR